MSLSVLLPIHLVGLALGTGCATAKLVMLSKARSDKSYVPVFISITKPITVLIAVGMILSTLSGIGWLIQGYTVTPRLITKLVLVAGIWVLGPIIDKVVEPRFRRLAPMNGAPVTPEFSRVHTQYLAVETIATLLFYAVIVYWVM